MDNLNQNCSKCNGAGYYIVEEIASYSKKKIYWVGKKYECEDCRGSGKYLKESNGYPMCDIEIGTS